MKHKFKQMNHQMILNCGSGYTVNLDIAWKCR